jgi:hypothetical protein
MIHYLDSSIEEQIEALREQMINLSHQVQYLALLMKSIKETPALSPPTPPPNMHWRPESEITTTAVLDPRFLE